MTGSPFLIETERLILREYKPGDLDDLFAILGAAETMRFYPAPYTLERTVEWSATTSSGTGGTASAFGP